ncbi:unnamed protein product [Protopolystoma xenopodis]|uniref:Uncharacterized protein n=1 Tax=Protopolystoma xenopodis TaxID=117903 RepID=A0A448WJW1_9PLAT|nr:unnamed protein product [Protopolystoma xenopodis]
MNANCQATSGQSDQRKQDTSFEIGGSRSGEAEGGRIFLPHAAAWTDDVEVSMSAHRQSNYTTLVAQATHVAPRNSCFRICL